MLSPSVLIISFTLATINVMLSSIYLESWKSELNVLIRANNQTTLPAPMYLTLWFKPTLYIVSADFQLFLFSCRREITNGCLHDSFPFRFHWRFTFYVTGCLLICTGILCTLFFRGVTLFVFVPNHHSMWIVRKVRLQLLSWFSWCYLAACVTTSLIQRLLFILDIKRHHYNSVKHTQKTFDWTGLPNYWQRVCGVYLWGRSVTRL